MDIIVIDGAEFVDLGGGIIAPVIDIETVVVDEFTDNAPAEIADLFGVLPAGTRTVQSMLRDGDGGRSVRTRRREHGARGTARRTAIAESAWAR